MTSFKTLDIRGLSFFSATDLMAKSFAKICHNGVLELILDKKKNFTDALESWAQNKGYKISDIDDGNRLIRIFIKKE